MTTVYFATNRAPDSTKPNGYGDVVVPNDITQIVFAVATVTNIQLPDENSGTITSIDDKATEDFSVATRKAIIDAKKNLLIFVHGFDNTFEDAIKRSAFNREWLAASGEAQADMTVLAFTWPSAGKLIAAPPYMPRMAYLDDQRRAGQSAFHIAHFLRIIDKLRADYLRANPNGRIILLAHSMGHHALSGAVERWYQSHDPDDLLFDEAILAAGDEFASCLARPDNTLLTDLRRLANRISVYQSENDVAMHLSTTINFSRRLGYDGPIGKDDPTLFPVPKFRIVNCSDVRDYDWLNPPDATHQYYRRSKIVQADLAAVVGGKGKTGASAIVSLP